MKKKDKELLLKDLSARLPYGVKVCDTKGNFNSSYQTLAHINGVVGEAFITSGMACRTAPITDLKPYLFPMSSMTDKQREEYESLCIKVTSECTEFYTGVTFTTDNFYDTIESFDYLYKNHIDVRGLIDKGLAIDATKSKVY